MNVLNVHDVVWNVPRRVPLKCGDVGVSRSQIDAHAKRVPVRRRDSASWYNRAIRADVTRLVVTTWCWCYRRGFKPDGGMGVETVDNHVFRFNANRMLRGFELPNGVKVTAASIKCVPTACYRILTTAHRELRRSWCTLQTTMRDMGNG